MRITVAAVGKPRNASLAAAIQDYEQRASRYWPLSVVEVKEESARGRKPEEVRAREADRLRAALPKGGRAWLCDPQGTLHTSEEFAAWLQRAREAARDIALLVGGAFGLDDTLRKDASGSIAFGRLTMSHELARLVLAEQLYRAGTIVKGEPYHK
ncbi:MAG TPA: 23S rRNA (pseudouridine(1915)-N(3))-methyltransferase RlmH [Gemmatimonadaceae bacterium]|nr:23S rRNA (pseudouridine(1915)-N(3))-methyltransferase RlmH [Gemmatimonadaceae bacterium]